VEGGKSLKFTERLVRIFKYAETEAEKTASIVYPIHLLLGLLQERSSVCAELTIQFPKLYETLNERVEEMPFDKDEQGISHEPFYNKISESTKMVIKNANIRKKHFKQVYINEGHIVHAIFKTNDSIPRVLFDELDVSRILEIVSFPRDMIVSLKDYFLPPITKNNITFRKAAQCDASDLLPFVKQEFGIGWLESIRHGFLQKNIPIFIAIERQEIVGFACYDVVRRKKGLFGPMGTTSSKRNQKIGSTLLHFCLDEMKEIGFEYAIIGEAGPIEFYEKVCNAVVIPKRVN